MACSSCKNAKRVAILNGETVDEVQSKNWLTKIGVFIAQFMFGTIVGCVLLIFVIPLLIYVIGCMMFGIEPKLRLRNPFGGKQIVNNPDFIEDAYKRMQQKYNE